MRYMYEDLYFTYVNVRGHIYIIYLYIYTYIIYTYIYCIV